MSTNQTCCCHTPFSWSPSNNTFVVSQSVSRLSVGGDTTDSMSRCSRRGRRPICGRLEFHKQSKDDAMRRRHCRSTHIHFTTTVTARDHLLLRCCAHTRRTSHCSHVVRRRHAGVSLQRGMRQNEVRKTHQRLAGEKST